MNQFTLKKLCLCILLSSVITACGGGDSAPSKTQNNQNDQNTNIIEPPTSIKPSNSQLAQINIDSQNQTILDEPKIMVKLQVIESVNNNQTVSYDGFAGIEYRGSSSKVFDKKSFGVETRFEDGSNLNTELLGMPAENDWVFNAPYLDKSLIRNTLIYSLSNQMGRYASRWRYTDLYLDGEYQGIYVLLETIKRDVARVDINKLKIDENSGAKLTGGYIIKIDKSTGENDNDLDNENSFDPSFSFISQHPADNGIAHHFIYNTPESDDITVEQKTYIQNYIADFENALKGPDYTDDLLGYPNYIDVDSFIDYFIISELSKNIDAYRLSTYLVKDKEQKLAMGPVWDFNLALGNAGFCNGEDTQGWAFEFNSICPNDAFPVPFWWPRLISDPNFSHQVKARWAELRADVLSDTNINQLIDQLNGILTNSNSLDANFEKWDIIDQWFWSTAHLVDTHQEEVDYLKQWINNRTLWLDANIPSL